MDAAPLAAGGGGATYRCMRISYLKPLQEALQKFGPIAVQAGAVVVDNSSAFRQVDDVPLIIPEINPEAIKQHKGIIANPNCSTIIAITPLWPIHKKNRIVRFIAATYQAASGAGAAAMEELRESTRAHLENRSKCGSGTVPDPGSRPCAEDSLISLLTPTYGRSCPACLLETLTRARRG